MGRVDSRNPVVVQALKSNFTSLLRLCHLVRLMWKKILPLLPILVLTGCAGTFTRLTPYEQPRNVNNVYPVEVAFNSQQQTLRWDSIKPYVLIRGEAIPLRAVPMV